MFSPHCFHVIRIIVPCFSDQTLEFALPVVLDLSFCWVVLSPVPSWSSALFVCVPRFWWVLLVVWSILCLWSFQSLEFVFSVVIVCLWPTKPLWSFECVGCHLNKSLYKRIALSSFVWWMSFWYVANYNVEKVIFTIERHPVLVSYQIFTMCPSAPGKCW